jgi:hypothetical protein
MGTPLIILAIRVEPGDDLTAGANQRQLAPNLTSTYGEFESER